MGNEITLTSRERIKRAINHKETDQVPIDFGGTDSTSIQLGPYKRLADQLEIEVDEPLFLHDLMQQQTEVSMDIANRMHSDVRYVYYGYPRQVRDGIAYDGTSVKVPDGFRPKRLPNGDLVAFDAEGQPIMKMPKDGFFFDFPYHNLSECKTIRDIEKERYLIENFDYPAWNDMSFEEVGQKAREVHENTDKFVVGLFGAHVFQGGQVLRGWSQFLMDLAGNNALAECLMEILVDGHIKNFDGWYQNVGPYVDAMAFADDMGIQTGLWINPVMYRKLVKPYHSRFVEHVKSVAPELTIFFHSCGSVYEIIPDIIEMGVDVLNPVQYTARNMDLSKLKKEFGTDLSFWGGGCDSQKVLPYGTPEQVKQEVRRNLEIMLPGGGYVFASIHNITEGVPAENIIALFEAAYQLGK